MGRRLAAAATLAATAAVATPRAGSAESTESEQEQQVATVAVGHVQVLQEKLEALVQAHRLLVRKHRGTEGELGEARAQLGLRDERIRRLEGAQAALERALRRQEERHITELAALREQALRVAGVLVLPSPGRGERGSGPTAGAGAGAGAGADGSDLGLMGSTSSFGAFDEDGGNGNGNGSPRPRSAVLTAAALLGSTLGLTRSMSVSEPKTIRGGINATIGGGGQGQGQCGTTGPLPPAYIAGADAGEGAEEGGGILSRLREGILGTILASPL